VPYAASGYFKEGVLLGKSDGAKFHSCSSDVPDIILRDPPGSNSFTSIEKVKRLVSQKKLQLMIGFKCYF
jgi:hypothetical protein